MKKYDLIVVGGGLTGIAASVCAAREGMSVLLCEQSGSLGGAMTNCLVLPFMRYYKKNEETGELTFLSNGFFTELRHRYSEKARELGELQYADHLMNFNHEIYKMVFDNVVNESGVDVLFHAKLCGVETEGREIKRARFATTAGELELEADSFIDATGDGNLTAFAGCEFILGRESDNLCQPMTTCFRLSGINVGDFWKMKPQINERYKAEKAAGRIKNPREDILTFNWHNGYIHFNTTRIVKLDPTNPFDVSKAEMIAREQVAEIVTFLKRNFEGFENTVISSIATNIGVRESRKLVGEYVLTVDDLLACKRFDDAIALGDYDIDIHNPEGSGTSHHYFKYDEVYSIPYRSLIPKEFDNLLVAGRCLSATHEAQASVRIMPICCCMGEAAGRAMALAAKAQTNIREIDITKLQKQLGLA